MSHSDTLTGETSRLTFKPDDMILSVNRLRVEAHNLHFLIEYSLNSSRIISANL